VTAVALCRRCSCIAAVAARICARRQSPRAYRTSSSAQHAPAATAQPRLHCSCWQRWCPGWQQQLTHWRLACLLPAALQQQRQLQPRQRTPCGSLAATGSRDRGRGKASTSSSSRSMISGTSRRCACGGSSWRQRCRWCGRQRQQTASSRGCQVWCCALDVLGTARVFTSKYLLKTLC
jgi:hypothetical protein